MRGVGRITARARRGFTLVELLLTVALVVLLLGAVVFNFSSLERGVALDEGAAQLEALLRHARAQAAATGRRVQVVFEEDVGDGLRVPLGHLRVLREPDPLNQPGFFEEWLEARPQVEALLELASIEEVWVPGAAAAAPNVGENAAALPPAEEPAAAASILTFAPITFQPDGSSDTSEIILASRRDDDNRRIAVQVEGVTGTIRRRPLVEEADEASRDETNSPSASPAEARSVSAGE